MEFPPDYLSSLWMIVANRIRSIIRRTREPHAYVKIVLRTVKLTAFFIMLACLQVSAGSTTAQKLSLSIRNGSLESLFATIEHKTGFTVFYNAMDVKSAKPITIDVKDASVEEVLQLSLKGQALTYFIQEHTIFIKKEVAKSLTDEPVVTGEPVQPGVSGVVKSETGTPLAGATVYIRKLKKAATTDAGGQFLLKNVPDGEYEVDISFVGYQTLTTTIKVVNHQAAVTTNLKQSTSQLDETVVKGYYTTTDRLNTGDVTTVKWEDIEKQPVTDPILALEGRVSGLDIQQTSGVPGAYSKIQIRGQNSIANGNDPLYIVDGVPFSSVSLSIPNFMNGPLGNSSATFNAAGGGMSPFNSLNPADIESIVVLKDADATAIYGSRGANGVILITTKRGKSGATRFDLNVYTGGGELTRMMDMLNTSQYLTMRREAFNNDGLAIPSIATNPGDNNYDIDGEWDTTRYTNWQKVLIGNTANFTNAQGSVSGGSGNTQFLIGGGYSKQGTAFLGDYSDQKTSAHVNLAHFSTDQRFSLQLGANFVYDNDFLPTGDYTSNSLQLAPDAPALYDRNGNLNWQILNGTATFSNPVASSLTSYTATTNNLISNLNLSYQFLPGLKLKSSFGYNHDEMHQQQLFPASASAPPYNTNPLFRSSAFGSTITEGWIIEPQLNYQHTLAGGRLEALIGSTFQQRSSNSSGETDYGFASDALINDPLAASTIRFSVFNNTLYRYNAIYGRLGYNWQDKYLLNITGRRDGSSRFGPGKQFGNFSSAGIGWIFTKENFIQSILPFVSFGKLRASYGTTGNDQIADYQYLSSYTPISSTYDGVTGLYPTRISNPYFAWEVVKKLEGGLDLGFIKDRVLISVDYYRNRTGNQLVGYPLPYVAGFSTVQFNLPAVVQNTGIEMTLNVTNIRTKRFSWTTSANLTIPSNKLVAFPNIASSPYAYTYIVGKSLFIQEWFHNTGVNPQTGLYSFETKDPNGPDYPQDLHATKPITQKYYGGVDNKLSYKGFELDIFVQYVDQLGYNYIESYGNQAGVVNQNEPTLVLNRWQSSGDLTNTQRFGTTGTTANSFYNFQFSDGIIANTSFVRLKNLALSYQLPDGWRSKLHLQTVRIYLQCQNLFTITGFRGGMDPETGGGLALPPLRMITAGLKVGL